MEENDNRCDFSAILFIIGIVASVILKSPVLLMVDIIAFIVRSFVLWKKKIDLEETERIRSEKEKIEYEREIRYRLYSIELRNEELIEQDKIDNEKEYREKYKKNYLK